MLARMVSVLRAASCDEPPVRGGVLHAAPPALWKVRKVAAGPMGPATVAGLGLCRYLQARAMGRAVGPPASGRAWQTAPSGGRRRCRQSPALHPPPPASHPASPPEGLSVRISRAVRRKQRLGPKQRQPHGLHAIQSGPQTQATTAQPSLLRQNLLKSYNAFSTLMFGMRPRLSSVIV